jgi:hypothetical protein
LVGYVALDGRVEDLLEPLHRGVVRGAHAGVLRRWGGSPACRAWSEARSCAASTARSASRACCLRLAGGGDSGLAFGFVGDVGDEDSELAVAEAGPEIAHVVLVSGAVLVAVPGAAIDRPPRAGFGQRNRGAPRRVAALEARLDDHALDPARTGVDLGGGLEPEVGTSPVQEAPPITGLEPF